MISERKSNSIQKKYMELILSKLNNLARQLTEELGKKTNQELKYDANGGGSTASTKGANTDKIHECTIRNAKFFIKIKIPSFNPFSSNSILEIEINVLEDEHTALENGKGGYDPAIGIVVKINDPTISIDMVDKLLKDKHNLILSTFEKKAAHWGIK